MIAFLHEDRRDINQVIFDFATHQRPKDHLKLLELLRGREIFASIASSNVPLVNGEKRRIEPGDDIAMRTATLPNGLKCAVFYVEKSDRRLGPQFAGMTAAEAFDMVTKTDVDALLIQNSQDSWVAFPKNELAAVRAKYLT